MRLLNVNGFSVSKNVDKYRINWDKKSRSSPQFKVKQFLKQYWFGHICYEEFPVYGTKMKVDILNATKKIAVEVNGRQHETYNKHFHNKSKLNFLKSIKRDVEKRKWLEKNGFVLIEINEDEAKNVTREFIKEKFGLEIV